MPAGENESRWRRIYLECSPGTQVARSEALGHSMVDWARLMFADVDALGHWEHQESLDGKADFVFWGRDGEQLAAASKAPPLGEGNFGWQDLPAREAAALAESVLGECDRLKLKIAYDVRPHSHHYELLKKIRQSETESGTLEIGGARLCAFMTRWGDGIFEIFRDTGPKGELARIRIELGTPERVKLMQELHERWTEFSRGAVVSTRVFEPSESVRYLYRELPSRDDDSGWRVFAGNEDDEYVNDADHVRIVQLQELVDRDPALGDLFLSPVGSAFERDSAGGPFRKCQAPPSK